MTGPIDHLREQAELLEDIERHERDPIASWWTPEDFDGEDDPDTDDEGCFMPAHEVRREVAERDGDEDSP